jgi:hypothetical protein
VLLRAKRAVCNFTQSYSLVVKFMRTCFRSKERVTFLVSISAAEALSKGSLQLPSQLAMANLLLPMATNIILMLRYCAHYYDVAVWRATEVRLNAVTCFAAAAAKHAFNDVSYTIWCNMCCVHYDELMQQPLAVAFDARATCSAITLNIATSLLLIAHRRHAIWIGEDAICHLMPPQYDP